MPASDGARCYLCGMPLEPEDWSGGLEGDAWREYCGGCFEELRTGVWGHARPPWALDPILRPWAGAKREKHWGKRRRRLPSSNIRRLKP